MKRRIQRSFRAETGFLCLTALVLLVAIWRRQISIPAEVAIHRIWQPALGFSSFDWVIVKPLASISVSFLIGLSYLLVSALYLWTRQTYESLPPGALKYRNNVMQIGMLALVGNSTFWYCLHASPPVIVVTVSLYFSLYFLRRYQNEAFFRKHLARWLTSWVLFSTLTSLFFAAIYNFYFIFVLAGVLIAGHHWLNLKSRIWIAVLITGIFTNIAWAYWVFLTKDQGPMLQKLLAEDWWLLPRYVFGPLVGTHPLLLCAGLICSAHIFFSDAARFVQDNIYRSSLLILVVAGPIGIPWFASEEHQLEYFMPFIPAYVLLTVEWLEIEYFRIPGKAGSRFSKLLGLLILALSLVCFSRALAKGAKAFLKLPESVFTFLKQPLLFDSAVLGLGLVLALLLYWKRSVCVGWTVNIVIKRDSRVHLSLIDVAFKEHVMPATVFVLMAVSTLISLARLSLLEP